jgi:uncharacterized protein DUF6611
MAQQRTLRRGWLRLVDGACPWGWFTVCPGRMGVTHYRLVIYPPGITETERRRLRVWRGWPMWGALLWIASYVVLTGLIEPRTALVISTATFGGTGVVAFMRAGDVRARVREMRATVMSGYPDPLSRDARRKLLARADTLIEADHRRQLGLLSPIEYEMTWWRVYDQIKPDHWRPHRRRW